MRDLNALQIFLKVVEKGSFTAAAKQLGVPKATVSTKVSALEKELGVRLLNRTTRAVTTTPDGEAYAARSGPLFQDLLEAESWISQSGKAPKGVLRVKAPTSYAQQLIAPALPRFLKAHPQLAVHLTVVDDQRTDIVQQGIDLVVSVGANHDSSLIAYKLGQSVRRLYASPEYLAAHPKIRVLEELQEHACLVCAHTQTSNVWALSSKSRQARVSVSGPLVASDYVPVIEAARQGLGVGLLPERMVREDVRKKTLKLLLPEWRAAPVEFHALIPSKKLIAPKVKAFIDFLRANPW